MSMIPPVIAELRGEISDFVGKMGQAKGAFDSTSQSMEIASAQRTAAIGKGLTEVGVVATAAGGILTKIADADQAAHNKLKQAVENTGHSYEEYGKKIESVESKGRKLGHSDAESATALEKLTSAYGDAGKATQMMGLAEDMAAKSGSSLTGAADQLVKIHAGAGGKAMKAYGISTRELADAQLDLLVKQGMTVEGAQKEIKAKTEVAAAAKEEATQTLIGAKAHGMAAAQANTFSGKLKGLAMEAEHYAAKLGVVGHVLTAIGPVAGGVGMVMQMLATRKMAAAMASSSLAAAETAETGSHVAAAAGATTETAANVPLIGSLMGVAAAAWAAVAPFLPIIAVLALLGLAAYELYHHWDEVFGFVKDISKDAYNFVKRNIDLFVIAIGLPLAPLFLLWKHWDQVWGAVSGAIGGAWDIVKGVFEEIKQGIEEVIGAVDKVTSKLGSLPGGGIIKGAASLFGYAEGGTVPGPVGAPQLAIVHGGEVVVPPNQVTSMGTPARAPAVGGGSGGNVVHINVTVHGSVWTTRDLATELAPLVDDAQRQRFQSGRGSAA